MKSRPVCADRCLSAIRDDCRCVCGGTRHGRGNLLSMGIPKLRHQLALTYLIIDRLKTEAAADRKSVGARETSTGADEELRKLEERTRKIASVILELKGWTPGRAVRCDLREAS